MARGIPPTSTCKFLRDTPFGVNPGISGPSYVWAKMSVTELFEDSCRDWRKETTSVMGGMIIGGGSMNKMLPLGTIECVRFSMGRVCDPVPLQTQRGAVDTPTL